MVTDYFLDCVPVTVSLCEPCDAAARRRTQLLFWAFALLATIGIALVWIMISYDPARPQFLDLIILAAIIAGLWGAASNAFVYLRRGEALDQRLLARFALKFAAEDGRDVIWTPKDFEKLRSGQ